VRPMGMLGTTFQARARGRNAAGDVIPLSFGDVEWSTDTPDILEVVEEGAIAGGASVTSLREGEGRVIARLGGLESIIQVPVREVARLAWLRRLDGFVSNRAPTIGPDGTIYASSSAQFWAIGSDGAEKWSAPTGYFVPAITADGALHFGTSKLDLSGATVWRFSEAGRLQFPVLSPTGILYAMKREGDVVALLAVDATDGELLWEYRTTARPPVFSWPALGGQGTIYFSVPEGILHAVAPDGDLIWSSRPGGILSLAVSPIVATDGTIYLGSLDHHLYALSPEDGRLRWSLDLGYEVQASAALGEDGTIYQTAGPMVYAISPEGEVRWSWTTDLAFPATGSPVVASNGTVYVGDRRGLLAIGPGGELLWDFSTELAVDAAPAIGLDGTVYVAAGDSTLYAIRELEGGNGGFDASPWPVWRGNRRNTGRAGS